MLPVSARVQFSVRSIVLLTMMVWRLLPGPVLFVRVTVFGLRTFVTLHAESEPLPTLVIFTVYPWLCSCAMVSLQTRYPMVPPALAPPTPMLRLLFRLRRGL